ncbi:serine/threonine-protein kinase [Nocardiopsis deserti]|uniref:serine/threonine-protein kinase n=1 Tax=Nocardiopsis deserti TaxID=2605988 RepID=UPI001239E2B9|nr:serine/threonine-protein kinase [Nocardiopsis deserti]
MRDLSPRDPRRVGPYRTAALLGVGGMGRVYLGLDGEGASAAVKEVRAEYAYDPDFRERFARELELLRRVHGPHTPRVLDADPAGRTPWMATEYVAGPSLHDLVQATGPLPEHTVRFAARGVAQALERVHAGGLVHRDLKPGNVMVSAAGPQVIDFGVARALGEAEDGRIIGTPGYMAPENVRRQPGGPPSDVFALGGLVVYALTGTGPFGEGHPSAVMYRITHQDPVLTGVPGPLRDIVSACLDKDPDRRPSAARVLSALGGPVEPAPSADTWLPPSAVGVLEGIGREHRSAVGAALREAEAEAAGNGGFAGDGGSSGDGGSVGNGGFAGDGESSGDGRRRPGRRLLVAGAAGATLVLTAGVGTWAAATLGAEEPPAPERPGERERCEITEHIAPEYARAAQDPPSLPSTSMVSTAFSADGRIVAAGGTEGLALWDWREGTEIARIGAEIDPLGGTPVLSPDGCRIGYAARDGAHVYTLETGEHTVFQQGTDIGAMAFSRDGGSLLLTDGGAGADSDLLRVDLGTDQVTDAYEGGGDALSLTVSPGGTYVAAVGYAGGVKVWKADGGERVMAAEGAKAGFGNNLELPNDEGDVVYMTGTGVVHVNFLDDGEPRVLEPAEVPENGLSEIALNPAADRLYANYTSGEVIITEESEEHYGTKVWEFSTGRELTAREDAEYVSWITVHPEGEVVTGLPLDHAPLWIMEPEDLSLRDSIG